MIQQAYARKMQSQSEKAYSRIKEMILREELRQGDVISTLMLSEELGIGRTPLTSAFQRLEYDGLVRVIPKQGVLVSALTIDDAREIYESRAAVESFFARKSFDLLDESDAAYLEELVEKQVSCGEKGDLYGFMEQDTLFHRYAMRKYDNKTLMETYDRLLDRIFLLGVKNSSSAMRFKSAIAEHRCAIACIRGKDKSGYVDAVERHIANGYASLTGIYML